MPSNCLKQEVMTLTLYREDHPSPFAAPPQEAYRNSLSKFKLFFVYSDHPPAIPTDDHWLLLGIRRGIIRLYLFFPSVSSLRDSRLTGQLMPQEGQLPPQPWHLPFFCLRRFTMEMTAKTAAARMSAVSTSVTASPVPVREAA